MTGRLINADELKNLIIKKLGIASEEFLLESEKAVFEEIDNAPTVEAEPVRHGHWIPKYDKWGDYVTTVECYECSACKETNWDEDKYCPWCGAKMDGERKEE